MTGQLQRLDVVARLDARADEGVVRGQVGRVVGELDEQTVEVEFSDNQRRAYAIVPVERALWCCITSP